MHKVYTKRITICHHLSSQLLKNPDRHDPVLLAAFAIQSNQSYRSGHLPTYYETGINKGNIVGLQQYHEIITVIVTGKGHRIVG